jgi:chemotaxis protein methyltransferase CheR
VSAAVVGEHASKGLRDISDHDFDLLRELIHKEAGIHLSQVKRALLVGRLSRRIRELGMESFKAYYDHVVESPEERVQMLDRISTNETHFFREPRHFEYVETQLVPAWLAAAATGSRPKKLRVWSAACSTGEEPYSLAMLLHQSLVSADGWEVEILATDISTRVLSAAQTAVWPQSKAHEIPPSYLKQYMLEGVRSQEGRIKAAPEIRAMVQFRRMNLNEPPYPVPGEMDLIFCRNVLIYFDQVTKRRVISQLLERLSPTGHLFLGHAESLAGLSDQVRPVAPTVYVRAEQGRTPRRLRLVSGEE